jgi:hypothetical protein
MDVFSISQATASRAETLKEQDDLFMSMIYKPGTVHKYYADEQINTVIKVLSFFLPNKISLLIFILVLVG